MNFKRTMMIVGIDLLVLVELAVAIYISAQGPAADSPALFLKVFVPAVIATLVIGRLAVRKFENLVDGENPPST